MPLIETISLTNQAINTALSIPFSASPANYDTCYFRIWLYDLAAASSAKTANIFITKSGSGVESRSSVSLTLTTGVTSVSLQSLPFVLATGDILRLSIAGGATDTANVDIVAELWGIPDLSAQITAVNSSLEIYISSETAPLATAAAVGAVSSVVNNIDSRLPAVPASASDVVSYVAVTAANAATLAAGNVAFLSYAHSSQVITSTSTEDLSSATKVWFALKDSYLETDAQSLIFIEKTAGLTHVGKSAIVSPIVTTDGSLTVGGSSGAWTFTVVLKSEAAAYLSEYTGSGKLGEIKATIGGLDLVIGTVTGAINSGVIRTNA